VRRLIGSAAVTAAMLLGVTPTARGLAEACTCASSRETNGWCPVHEIGYVGGIKVTSRWLYEFMDAHGHQLDLSTFTCPTCKSAIATNGFCELHHVGFVNQLAYYSLLTYELGKAEARPPSTITCATCRKNSETYGWCARSGLGMVGPFVIRNRQDYDRAVSALKIFLVANETAKRCNYCAGAILTNSECPACRIRYKDGKAMPSVQ
jgi:hypothetical protein